MVTFIILALTFLILGIIFLAGKGSSLIAGYNTMSKEQKNKYDEEKAEESGHKESMAVKETGGHRHLLHGLSSGGDPGGYFSGCDPDP